MPYFIVLVVGAIETNRGSPLGYTCSPVLLCPVILWWIGHIQGILTAHTRYERHNVAAPGISEALPYKKAFWLGYKCYGSQTMTSTFVGC